MRKYNTQLCILHVLFALFITGCSSANSSSFDLTDTGESSEIIAPLTVHYLDVGQGDCTLITQGNHAMLIDAGPGDQEIRIRHYLDNLKIQTLDYMIITHPDEDHIGSADAILKYYDCQNIWMPETEQPSINEIFSFGNASFTVLSPSRYYADDNDNSLVLHLTHGENTFLFTGDAGYKAEKDILDSGLLFQADVLKTGHHGSSTSTSQTFLDTVAPAYAVISCGTDNDYGHPHKETLDKLEQADITLYRTDEQGTITVTSDGISLDWQCFPTELQTSYVVNTRTGKIHLPSCENVPEIAENNKEETNLLLDTLLHMGYNTCGWCLP